MNTLTHDAATERLARDNALLLGKLAQLETKLDAILGQAEPLTPPPAVPETPAKPPLTPRKIEVLKQVAEGKGNQQIAHELCLSPGTVKHYLLSISRELAAKNRWHAVVIAQARGLL